MLGLGFSKRHRTPPIPPDPSIVQLFDRFDAERRAKEARAALKSEDQARAAIAAEEAARLERAQRDIPDPAFFSGLPAKWRRWSGFADFCERELMVLTKEDKLIPFKLRYLQRQIVLAEIRARRRRKRPAFLVLKYRKLGVTTVEQALSYWTIWAQPHKSCLTFAHTPDDTRFIFRTTVRFYDRQPPAHRHMKTPARTMFIDFPDWDGVYLAKMATEGVGRGGTYARIHVSEAAHVPDLIGLHAGLVESRGDESAYVLESTPNGQEGRGQAFFEFWQAAKRGQNEFTPLFFAWFDDPENQTALLEPDEISTQLQADDEAREMMERYRLTLPQMKWWFGKRAAISATGKSAQLIWQEQPVDDLSCFLLSGTAYYDLNLLKVAERQCIDPISIEENGRLRIYELPDKDAPASYLFTGDPAEGTGGDDSALTGWNLRTGRQAFSWRDNRTAPSYFGSDVIPRLAKRWKNPANGTPPFVLLEANNHGHAAHTGLLRIANYPVERVYHRTDEAAVNEYGEPKPGRQPGWHHGPGAPHADLTDAIGRILVEGYPKILDRETVASIRRVTGGPNGAEFNGRDLAVTVGLAGIGWAAAKRSEPSGKLYVGGKLVDLDAF